MVGNSTHNQVNAGIRLTQEGSSSKNGNRDTRYADKYWMHVYEGNKNKCKTALLITIE